jgi:murein DD-endopeptidase MepM/ murein hydrolase activator NlpD
VVAVGDGWPDIMEFSQLGGIFGVMSRTARMREILNSGDYRMFAGNYVIVRSERCSALLAHLRNGSVKVTEGQHVRTGDLLAEVGNSGNTVSPHLHFQLMKGDDPVSAIGLPCRFRCYERYKNKAWETVTNGVPGRLERIRYLVE